MRKIFLLLKEFLVRPAFIVVEAFFAILGNFDTIVSHWTWLRSTVSGTTMNEPINFILSFFSQAWGYLLLLALSIAIFDGFYKKTRAYLGEQVRAKIIISISEKSNDEQSILVVTNNEKVKLDNCHAKIERVDYQEYGRDKQKITLPVSAKKLVWRSVFFENKYASITSISGDGGKDELGLARIINNKGMGFDYDDLVISNLNPDFKKEGKYFVEVRIDGEISGKPIFPVFKTYQVEIGMTLDMHAAVSFGIQKDRPRLIIREVES